MVNGTIWSDRITKVIHRDKILKFGEGFRISRVILGCLFVGMVRK